MLFQKEKEDKNLRSTDPQRPEQEISFVNKKKQLEYTEYTDPK